MPKPKPDINRSILSRQRFFNSSVHIQEIKDCLSGENEKYVIKIIEGIGYKLGQDFVRQYPIGERFVLDFSFVKEQIAIEVDGKNHNLRKNRLKDNKRDSYLRENNWISLRIKDREFRNNYKMSFWKSLIKEIVEERRGQWERGTLYPINMTTYNEKDYE